MESAGWKPAASREGRHVLVRRYNRNVPIQYQLNPTLDNEALNALYAVSWPRHEHFDFVPVFSRAVAYLHAFDEGRLVGSVYVAWDGAQHAFLLEPTVHPEYQRRGIGTELVRQAAAAALDAGCETLHVDYEASLTPFYEACGFEPTAAGLIRLRA
jgi:GNAT superfamily N-acetyltransferase